MKMVSKNFTSCIFRLANTFPIGNNNEVNTLVVSNAIYSSVESKSQPSKSRKGLQKLFNQYYFTYVPV